MHGYDYIGSWESIDSTFGCYLLTVSLFHDDPDDPTVVIVNPDTVSVFISG